MNNPENNKPKLGLVVIGNPSTLSADPRWLSWLTWAEDKDLFASEDDVSLPKTYKNNPFPLTPCPTTMIIPFFVYDYSWNDV